MPVQKIKGLRGLEGIRRWDELSDKDKEAYLNEHPQLRERSVADVSKIYDNSNYIKEFGKKDFLANPDKAWRDARLKKTVVDRAKADLWGDGYSSLTDQENDTIKAQINGLTDDGFIELANRENFRFPTEANESREAWEKSNEELKDKRGLGAWIARTGLAYARTEDAPVETYQQDEIINKTNAGIIESVTAKDNERKLANASALSSQYMRMFDQMSQSKVEDEFRNVFEGQEVRTGFNGNRVDYTTPGIGLYKEFKNHDEMANFGFQEKKKFLADYYAVAQLYGPGAAEQATITSLQNYIHGNQDWEDWVGSAARGMGAKTVASFGQLGMGLQALYNTMNIAATQGDDAAKSWLTNFMLGKDENGKERPWYDNMRFWNGMDQYGVLPIIDADAFEKIKEIEENGGISPYNWISEAGNDMNLSSALNEGLKMVGYMAAQYATGKMVGFAGKGAAKLAGGAFSEVTGLYHAELSSNAANFIMKYATPGLTSALNAVPISVGYAKGSFDEVLREGTDRADYEAEKYATNEFEKLNNQINTGITLGKNGFGVSEKSTNPTEDAKIADELNNWVVTRYNNLVRQQVPEEQIDVAGLYDEALGKYKEYRRNQYLNNYKETNLYKDMIEVARKEAASAYERNATIEFLRMAGVNYLFRQWQQDKSVRAAMNSNYPNLQAVDRGGKLVATGKLLGTEISPEAARWITPLKSLWSGFESNYMDDVTAAYAKGFSLGRYNDYVAQLLDSDKAAATTSWAAGFTSALTQAENALVDKRSFYDGFIGALGSGEMIAPGRAAASLLSRTGRSNWNAKLNYSQQQLANMAQKYGLSIDEYINGDFSKYVKRVHPNYTDVQVQEEVNKIRQEDGFEKAVEDGRIERRSFVERLSSIVYNPMLNQYAEAAERERDFKAIIDGGNKAIAEKRDAIEDMIRAVYSANARALANKSDSTFEGKEAKALQAFTLVSTLSRWLENPILSNSEFVQQSWAKIQDLARGNVEQADIDNFYASVENKSERERSDAEDFAKQRLTSNAKQLVKMKEAYDKSQKTVRDSKEFRVIVNHSSADSVAEELAYQDAMLENRETRQQEIHNQLGLSSNEESSVVAEYGSEQGARNAIEYLDERIEQLNKEISTIDEHIKAKPSRNDGTSRTLRRIRKQSERLSLQELIRERDELTDERARIKGALESIDFGRVLTSDEILGLSDVQRAKMLDSKNSSLYSKQQNREIKKAIKELEKRGKRAGVSDVMEKVQDLAKLQNAIQDTQRARDIMGDNMEAAADYFGYAKELRARSMYDALERHHYKEVEGEILKAKRKSKKAKIAKQLSSKMLERFKKDHPDHTDILEGVTEIAKVSEDAKTALDEITVEDAMNIYGRVRQDGKVDTEEDQAVKDAEVKALGEVMKEIKDNIASDAILLDDVTDRKTFMTALEQLTERQTDPRVRDIYQRLLEKLDSAKYSRSSTTTNSKAAQQQAAQQKAEAAKNANGKNFGWDGYVVGDTVYHTKLNKQGKVVGFIRAAEGEPNGSIRVAWNGEKGVVIYRDKDTINKTKPEQPAQPEQPASQQPADNTKKNAEIELKAAILQIKNADYNIDKLDGVVAAKLAEQNGAELSKEDQETVDQAIKELEEAGVDYRIHLNPMPTNAFPEEVVGEEMPDFTEDGGAIVHETTVEEAVEESGQEAIVVENDKAEERANGEQPERRNDPGLMEGNGLYEYSVNQLVDFGIIERRPTKTSTDTLANFFKWLDTNNIKLQEIIDNELSLLYRRNPNLKLKFMVSNDPLTSRHVMLVVDYNSTVSKIHDEKLGGVITATNGTEDGQYLVVGTIWDNRGDKAAYNRIGNPMKAYLDSHPEVQNYVHPEFNTKIAKMDAGRLIRRQAGETTVQYRSLGELFNDSSRNPSKIDYESAILGIMYENQFFVPNRTVPNSFYPGKSDSTLGRVFLMIPAANGNYIPIALKTDLYINSPEFKDGNLKMRVTNLLRRVASPELAKRKAAITELSRLVKFDSEGGKVVNGLLVGSEAVNNISLILNGNEVRSWTIDANFDAQEFISAVMKSPFRINVTQRALSSPDTIRELDEAGALQTDVSTLRTGNVAYQVFWVGSDGNPRIVDVKKPVAKTRKVNVSKANRSTKPINGKVYRLINGEYYDEFSDSVTDKALRISIYYNLLIQQRDLKPFTTSDKSGREFYIVNNSQENPVVIGRDTNGNIQVLSPEASKRAIDFANQQAELQRQREAAAAELERIEKGLEGVVGESLDGEEQSPAPAVSQQPAQQQPVFIEPKHADNVEYGPAISVLSTKERYKVPTELHSKTETLADGTKVTTLIGWDNRGVEVSILTDEQWSLDIPMGYKVPEGKNIDDLVGVSEIMEYPDGRVVVKAMFRNADESRSVGSYTLERVGQAPARPAQQQQSSQPAQPASNYDPNTATTKSLQDLQEEGKNPTFDLLFLQREDEFYDIAEEKGWEIGETPSEAKAFLKTKLGEDFDFDAISDVETFMDNLRNCL